MKLKRWKLSLVLVAAAALVGVVLLALPQLMDSQFWAELLAWGLA
jgi:hypothetical protein